MQKVETKADYDAIMDKQKGKNIFIQFSAEWCMACSSIEDDMTELAKSMANKMEFLYIDCENEELEELPDQFEVSSMPTFVVIKNGAAVDQCMGTNFDKIKTFAEKYGAEN